MARPTFSSRRSLWETRDGNLPLLLRPGPNSLGICLMTASDAKKAAYFFAAAQETPVSLHQQLAGKKSSPAGKSCSPSFFTSFLFLFSFLRSSTDIASTPRALASSQCLWSPSTQT